MSKQESLYFFKEPNMSPQNKIIIHPDKEEIIKWILDGVSVRDVAARLQERYPHKRQAHLRMSPSTVQNFKTEYLNLKGEMLSLVKEEIESRKEHTRNELMNERKGEIQAEVRESNAYREKIGEIIDTQIDVQGELLKIWTVIDSRMEYFFNKLQAHEYPNVKEERAFQNYIDQFLKLLEHYKKFVEGYNEKVEHSVNVTIMTAQVTELREAVREVLAETSPELAVGFMQKLNVKMKTLEYHSSDSLRDATSDISLDLFSDEVIIQDD